MMDPARLRTFPALAPLSPPVAVHLASHLVRHTSRDAGRPPGSTRDIAQRAEQRLLAALESLVPRVQRACQEVYQTMDTIVQAGALSPSWLLQALSRETPGDGILYPQRLVDMRREGVLHYNRRGQPDPQSVAGVLVARKIDPRRRGWLPFHLDQTERNLEWACWQQTAPDVDCVPYFLTRSEEKVQLPLEQSLLWTPWKGATWLGWQAVANGAIAWAAPERVTAELLARWAPYIAGEATGEQDLAELSRQTLLSLAADRLPN
jgi:hypothetical protein